MKRLNILISAYACQPGRGSEPGVGWNFARAMARHHNIWVLTRRKNRPFIEAEIERDPVADLNFVYYDLPAWAGWWRRGERGVQLYYYLWQIGAYEEARRLRDAVALDVAHHVTFVKYWSPSFLAFLNVPYVWGPVGGGESAPRELWRYFSWRGKIYEMARDAARWLGERDPLVRLTAERSLRALATTPETAQRLRRLNARHVGVVGESGLNDDEIEMLSALPLPSGAPFTFISLGRLLHWKGFHLGIHAFAQAGLNNADYWIIGDGPELDRLKALARRLKVSDRVRFPGRLNREDALRLLGQSHVLVHPSLHDSGGWVCLEAMAAARPILCMDIGGPAMQVTPQTGVKVPTTSAPDAVEKLADAMKHLASNPKVCAQMGAAGRARVEAQFRWGSKIEMFAEIYSSIGSDRIHTAEKPEHMILLE